MDSGEYLEPSAYREGNDILYVLFVILNLVKSMHE